MPKCVIHWFQVIPATDSGQRLINDALKMISGCIIPTSVITNSGSLSTTYIGSVLFRSDGSAEMDSINSVTLSLSTSQCNDVSQFRDLKAHAFSTTLFPVSAVLNSCFGCQKPSPDAAVYQSATLTFGAGILLTHAINVSFAAYDFKCSEYMIVFCSKVMFNILTTVAAASTKVCAVL